MTDIRFLCPGCKARLAVEETVAGCQAPCPTCKQMITIPKTSDPEMAQPALHGGVLTPDEVSFLSQHP